MHLKFFLFLNPHSLTLKGLASGHANLMISIYFKVIILANLVTSQF